jgi:GntR family transcriptional regulator / MocR family aminotransferase
MATWNVAIALSCGDIPKFRQLATAIAEDIQRGRLVAGTKLPSSRALAEQLEVNRGTVIAAYRELEAGRWIAIEAARGAFVIGIRDRPRDPIAGSEAATTLAYPRTAAFALDPKLPGPSLTPATPRHRDLLLLLGGVPELRTLPTPLLARAYRRVLTGSSSRRLFDAGHPQGNARLRDALVDLLTRARGITAPAEAIMVVHGSQHGLYLAARTLIRPGDLVAVEEPGYRPAWRALELAGATLIPIPIDRDGLQIDALAAIDRPVRALYTTPHHQYPTTVTLAAERRLRLLELARARQMIILEDDYDFDFHYQGRPALPLAASDRAGSVVYFGTLSKILAPGLRLGYVVAPLDVMRRIAAYRRDIDTQGDHALEQAVAILLEDGDVQRHARRMAGIYRRRRDALASELRNRLPQLEFELPSGGMAIWARASGIDTDAWVRRGLAAGVAFQAGRRFTLDDCAYDFVRIGFAACTEHELVEAVDRMVIALRLQ